MIADGKPVRVEYPIADLARHWNGTLSQLLMSLKKFDAPEMTRLITKVKHDFGFDAQMGNVIADVTLASVEWPSWSSSGSPKLPDLTESDIFAPRVVQFHCGVPGYGFKDVLVIKLTSDQMFRLDGINYTSLKDLPYDQKTKEQMIFFHHLSNAEEIFHLVDYLTWRATGKSASPKLNQWLEKRGVVYNFATMSELSVAIYFVKDQKLFDHVPEGEAFKNVYLGRYGIRQILRHPEFSSL